jgi:hypothetical protein
MWKLIILWTTTIFLLGFAFLPYKPTKDPFSLADDELYVVNHRCNICPDFGVVRGHIEIPESLKKYLHSKHLYINVSGNDLPFSSTGQGPYYMSSEGFILTGKVIGIDSSSIPGDNTSYLKYAKYRVESWAPEAYHSKLSTMSKLALPLYFLCCLVFVISSLLQTIKTIRASGKRKTEF